MLTLGDVGLTETAVSVKQEKICSSEIFKKKSK